MDIEYSEYDALWHSIRHGDLKNIKQLSLEVHLRGEDKRSVFVAYQLLDALDKIGFKKYYNNRNMACRYESPYTKKLRTKCHELYYINANFL